MMDGYPQFLAPCGASSLRAIAIGLLAETFSVLIINLLQAMIDTETDFSQSGQVCNLSMLYRAHYRIFKPIGDRVLFAS